MPVSNLQVGSGPVNPTGAQANPSEPVYEFTFVEAPNMIVSIFRQLRERLREPKITVPRKYYRGEAALPVTEMRPWYRDLPNQIRVLFEKPTEPIGIFNHRQEKWRIICGAASGCVAAILAWAVSQGQALSLGYVGACILGYVAGYLIAIPLFKKRDYPPDIWQDYRLQPGSWVNSLMVHVLGLTALLMPFVIQRMMEPVKAAPKYDLTDISLSVPQLPGPDKRMGGGGGGGDRSPTPASKGAAPKFAKEQLAPPMAKIPNLSPQLPVQPTILGPPELKLPQMAANMPWGDPQGVVGPPSNGPGYGGGIGSGVGTGIGSGKGGGLGPGEGGGYGGGPYSVGGNVTEPIPIYKPTPPYSEEARKAKYQGTVVLWIVVDAQGNVTDVRVAKPLGLGLDEKAVETVRTWKFKPGTRNGVPVPVHVLVEVSFRLF